MGSQLAENTLPADSKQCDLPYKTGYYAELSNHIERHGPQSLKKCIHSIVERLGFTHFSFINANRADVEQIILNTLPESIVLEYYNECLFDQDMIVQRALSHPQTGFVASSIHDYVNKAPFQSAMTRCMNCIYQLNKSHGFYDFYHIPMRCSPHNDIEHRYLFSVTIRGLNPFDFGAKVLAAESSLVLLAEAIAQSVIHHASDLLPKDHPSVTTIRPKPLRVLNLLANSDCTIEQIANDLSISVVTANHHLKSIRNHFNVKTNYAAIKKALLTKLITYQSPPG